MKGVVFTQLMEMVEDKFGFDIKDEVIEKAGVDGLYTQAGNYPSSEMFDIIEALSELTNMSVEDLVYSYGMHLFSVLLKIYPKSTETYKSSFEFISKIEDVIHPEVKKLYPDSQLPTFEMISMDNKEMRIVYKSTQPLMELAKGLMIGCSKYFNENIDVCYEKSEIVDGKFQALFILVVKD